MTSTLQPTVLKTEQIREAFNGMIEAIPKTRLRHHAFAINEVCLIIEALARQAKLPMVKKRLAERIDHAIDVQEMFHLQRDDARLVSAILREKL